MHMALHSSRQEFYTWYIDLCSHVFVAMKLHLQLSDNTGLYGICCIRRIMTKPRDVGIVGAQGGSGLTTLQSRAHLQAV